MLNSISRFEPNLELGQPNRTERERPVWGCQQAFRCERDESRRRLLLSRLLSRNEPTFIGEGARLLAVQLGGRRRRRRLARR